MFDALIEEDEDFNKVTPFGGFSRPDYMELLTKKDRNVFATAPWKVVPTTKGNGSLKNALKLAVDQHQVKDVTWVGTLSMASDLIPESTKDAISNELKEHYNSETVFIDDEVFHGHYTSFCKEILWPIFHYQIPDNPKSNAFENHSWNYYERLNLQFANRIASIYKDGDEIWVHDYHLMLVPAMLRKMLPNAKIGFFLHVSFPSSEVFRCLAQRKRILEGLLGADCICFQTEEYVRHFFQSCNRLLLADFDAEGVKYNGRNITISHHAIGIDADILKKQIFQNDVVVNWRGLIRDRWPDKMLIVSRDKIDKIRGVKEKLLAYERFLDENPSYLSKSLLILICIGHDFSSDLDDYETEISPSISIWHC
ncbi:unnamed protein product [Ambrosiozyma monospora]|uniref:Unnamed protein product n=1 Tax=Ambrosiozyma monospora TaxID=43982 RepID=A0ACB5TXD0_AMBMO|nr:unnamed protein product [Ambrosiozyma monospora]